MIIKIGRKYFKAFCFFYRSALISLLNFITFGYLNLYFKEFYSLSYHESPKFLLRLILFLKSKLYNKRDVFYNKRIAIIGNAESILDKNNGRAIDSNDLVIRINRANIISPESQGSRTNIWATSFSYDLDNSIKYKDIIWLYPFFHGKINYPYRNFWSKNIIFYRFKSWLDLKDDLGSVPSSGLMVLDYLIKNTEFKTISLYGFDFFETPNLYEKKDISNNPHDFEREKRYIKNLASINKKVYIL